MYELTSTKLARNTWSFGTIPNETKIHYEEQSKIPRVK